MIIWKATSVNGLVEYEQESESFKELFDELDERGIISDPDSPFMIRHSWKNTGNRLMMPILKMIAANLIMGK